MPDLSDAAVSIWTVKHLPSMAGRTRPYQYGTAGVAERHADLGTALDRAAEGRLACFESEDALLDLRRLIARLDTTRRLFLLAWLINAPGGEMLVDRLLSDQTRDSRILLSTVQLAGHAASLAQLFGASRVARIARLLADLGAPDIFPVTTLEPSS